VFNKYYQDELQFLRELGEEFAKAHPAAAHYLSGPGTDPDVERMLEGFAFLSARVRQRLDDEFPELAHSLMQLLWPHYLRPVPSMAILEFQPVLQALRQSQTIPRGCEVQSTEVEGTPCRFHTSQDVRLHPISLEDVGLEMRSTGASRLKLGFKIWNQVKPETLQLDRLRLFLHGDPLVTYALYFHLVRHVSEVRVVAGPQPDDRGSEPFQSLEIEPAGFGEDESLLPYPVGSFPGYRLLQEYFALPEKFLFLDVVGLDRAHKLLEGERFTIDVRFDRALPPTLRPGRDEFRLYCSPVVNLFPNDGDPIRIDRSQTEYRLRPQGSNPFHYEIFSVDRVGLIAPGTVEEREVPDFHGFEHLRHGTEATYFQARLRPSVVDDRVDTYVAFVDSRGESALPALETATFKLTCSNRRLPEALQVGDIHVPTDSSPAFVKFRNITPATSSATPPLGGDLHWRLISHLSLNYVSLVDAEALRGVLELYNFQVMRDPRAARANTRRLQGIHALRSEPAEALVRGSVVRGTAINLDALEDHFAGEGDLFLFSTILNEFLSLHATLNSFTQFSVHGLQGGETLEWPHRIGQDLL
jgi:type VI secretion system protein ImpG